MPAVIPRVAGVGLACPLGLRSRPALAAIAAGMSRFVEREDVASADGTVKASMLLVLEPSWSRAIAVNVFDLAVLARGGAGSRAQAIA